MPASDRPILMGYVFIHTHGQAARCIGSVYVEWRSGLTTYMDEIGGEGRTAEDVASLVAAMADAQETEYYSISIERTFMPMREVEHQRRIVTTPPV